MAYRADMAQALNEAMDEALGRVSVALPTNQLVTGLRQDLEQSVNRAAALAGVVQKQLFEDLRRIISDPKSRSFEIGIVARRSVEFLVADLYPPNRKGFELWRKIDSLAEAGVADWIRSYMHVLRVFGNESAHERATERRRPVSITDADLALSLFCLQRLLDFWVECRQ